jgi:hypothetical protein
MGMAGLMDYANRVAWGTLRRTCLDPLASALLIVPNAETVSAPTAHC